MPVPWGTMCGFYPYLYFDPWEPAVRQSIVVYGKGTKKEANVISFFLMTSEWHPLGKLKVRHVQVNLSVSNMSLLTTGSERSDTNDGGSSAWSPGGP